MELERHAPDGGNGVSPIHIQGSNRVQTKASQHKQEVTHLINASSDRRQEAREKDFFRDEKSCCRRNL